ncbi:MAG TPA: penicillin-binding protein 2 [Elusimicrobia bacterium]|nr:MAG: penicillin-binding protein 2 [Elusimicrobia bacterium GWF2_62_30]HBA61815.1 penicillin-binding protein 2 [Elusimicrobiota bacterium]
MIDRQIPQDRLDLVWTLSYGLLLLFLLRLINLQVLNTAHYREIAEKNRTQIIAQSAPRGRIFSSDETAIATSKPSFSLIYFPGQLKAGVETDRMAMAISRQLGADYESIKGSISRAALREKPVRLAENLPPKAMLKLSELKAIYPGIDIIVEARRYYPFGAYLSHLVGYIGKMDTKEWASRSMDKNYSMDSRTGKAGLEKMYERELKGKDGGIFLEVDSRGRLNRVLESRKWAPGSDIFLTIDSKAQAAAEEGLEKSLTGKGAVVALDPRTGAVLAFVSMPDYDPNQFVLSGSEKDKISSGKTLPEFNVALQGSYPPGSIFKIITGAAILESGRLKPEETFFCPGYYDAGSRVFKCWEKKGHNKVDFITGLTKSCDVYFYNAGQRAGALTIEKYSRAFRLGQPSGIALPEEKGGNVFGPGPRAAKKSYWFIGDTLNLSIGQGETLMTPMQAVGMIAAVANGGLFHRPYYVDRIVRNDGQVTLKSKPEILSRAELKETTWTLIRDGLHNVVFEGTGQMAKITGAEMFGKTGTAQNPQGKDHAWFVAYATVNGQPSRVAVAVLVEHGLHGASAAAPIAKAVIEAVLREDLAVKKPELPFVGPPAEAPAVKPGARV